MAESESESESVMSCELETQCAQFKYCRKNEEKEKDRSTYSTMPCFIKIRRHMGYDSGKPEEDNPEIGPREFIKLSQCHYVTVYEYLTFWICPACEHHIIWNNEEPLYCSGCGSKIIWKQGERAREAL